MEGYCFFYFKLISTVSICLLVCLIVNTVTQKLLNRFPRDLVKVWDISRIRTHNILAWIR